MTFGLSYVNELGDEIDNLTLIKITCLLKFHMHFNLGKVKKMNIKKLIIAAFIISDDFFSSSC